MTIEINHKCSEWLKSGDTGISSRTMLSAITGIPTGESGHPHDIADIGRCVRMLRFIPDLRSQIAKVAEAHIEWRPFIDCWDDLERGYDACVKFEALPEAEQKKVKRQKHFTSPNDRYWQVMQQLTCASRYLRGWRCQGSVRSWTSKAPNA